MYGRCSEACGPLHGLPQPQKIFWVWLEVVNVNWKWFLIVCGSCSKAQGGPWSEPPPVQLLGPGAIAHEAPVSAEFGIHGGGGAGTNPSGYWGMTVVHMTLWGVCSMLNQSVPSCSITEVYTGWQQFSRSLSPPPPPPCPLGQPKNWTWEVLHIEVHLLLNIRMFLVGDCHNNLQIARDIQ